MTMDHIGRLFGLYNNLPPIPSISYIGIRIFDLGCPGSPGNSGG
jgi:hypothetical protein